MNDLDEFILTELHNERVRINLEEYSQNPEKIPGIANTVNYELHNNDRSNKDV